MSEHDAMSDRPAAPELAAVEVRGMTREAFLVRGVLATAAAYGLGAVTPFVREALAQRGVQPAAPGDVGVLNFVLTLQLIEKSVYDEARDRAPLGGGAGSLIDELRRDEDAHVAELRRLIVELRGQPVAPPDVTFGTTSSRRGVLDLAQTIEDTVVFAMNGAVPDIVAKETLSRLAAVAQVDARHAALVAMSRGANPAPKAFEDTLSISQARAKLTPYVSGFGAQ
jgi:Ferritin-like domain